MTVRTLSLCFTVVLSGAARCQFYPDQDATWCIHNNSSPDGFDYVLQMSSTPDTVIAGVNYQRISAQYPFWGPEFFVRSSAEGLGYMYFADGERLTGDIGAAVGDTVHDVTVLSDIESCGMGMIPYEISIVVDSIVSLSNAGVSVIRFYVHTPCYTSGNFLPDTFFWQAGMGTAHGPLLILSAGLSHYDLRCAMVHDTCQFNWLHWPDESPGGPPCCAPLSNSLNESLAHVPLHVSPNPASAQVTVETVGSFASAYLLLLDATGRGVLFERTSAATTVLELGSLCAGLYSLRLMTDEGCVAAQRLVVQH